MTPLAPYGKPKFLGSGGSMVAKLKLKGIDGRAPPGVEPAAPFYSAKMSADLQWMILRNNSCFLLRNQGTTFTKEPLNLTGRHSFKNCGLINKKAVGVTADPTGKGVVLTTKKNKYVNKPAKVLSKVTLTSNSRRTVKTIKNLCGKSFYRQDLEDAAVRRASAILRSQRATTGVQKKRTRRKRN